MSEKPWKRNERRIAGLMGGRRVPISGRGRGDVPDIDHADFSIECKERTTFPAWLVTAMVQAKAATRGNQTPLVVLHQAGQRHDRDLILLCLEDFLRLFPQDGKAFMGEG